MVTAKPREIRMGKGKGAFAFWSRTVEVGSPLFEISFVKFYPAEYLFHFFRRFRAKFTVPVRLVERCPKRFFLG
jgi:ribosomal protein L16/L10AE